MSILKTIGCDVCGASQTEEVPNQGWPLWGQLMGVGSGEATDPHLCPECLAKVGKFLGTLEGGA